MGQVNISVKVNGQEYQADVDTRMLLVELLREKLNLTGTHVGCLTGNCGVCTVIMDDVTVKSCTILAAQANGAEVTTIEGLSKGLELNYIQQAFSRNFAAQCGFCTPGMIITAHFLLSKNSDLNLEEIKQALTGNLCRCTGYQHILKAILEAAKASKAGVGT